MRASALLALGAYAAVARADDDAASSAAEAAPTAVDLPTFTASNAKKENTDEEWAYVGTWNVEEPTVYPGMKGDKGLVLKDKAAHHAISAKFDKPISNKGKTLVVQYEVKLQSGLECGGAYMKLLQDNKALKSDEFSNASPYIIMFGPDRCGSTNKVHFIFRHKNPKTGEYEEKHMTGAPAARLSKTSALYTLIVNPDQTFEIRVDGEEARKGSLLEDFDPAVNPAKQIDDPNDKKPAEWVDEAQIDDPEAVKPADWDETAPYEIVDEEAEKPADWLEDEPAMVADPEAVKPEDWDDEEDGDWIAPKIPNPKCDEISGCGPWTKPMKKNPDYKGKWLAPRVDNPLYKGPWAPRLIDNPDFFEDTKPSNFEPMGAIGFELWTMQNDILFDNIYIGHSIEDAERIQKETFDIKSPKEKAQEDAAKVKPEDMLPKDTVFTEQPVEFVKEKLGLFVEVAKRDPVGAVRDLPEVAIGLVVTIGSILFAVFGLLAGGAAVAPSKEQVKEKAQQAKDTAAKTKDQVASAVASGADKARDEVNKRRNN